MNDEENGRATHRSSFIVYRGSMKHISKPAVIAAAGNKPKRIEEFIGRVSSGTSDLSIARMTSPSGWVEPGQTPEFDEYTVVLRGALRVTGKSRMPGVKA